jgi:hypothetical protein
MLQNGVYEISFQSIGRIDRANAILRDGTILGSDKWGAVFAGQWQVDAHQALDHVTLRLQVPPKGELITGFSAGPHGAIVDIVGAFAHDQAGKRAKIEIGGQPLDVELSFVSPLPS